MKNDCLDSSQVIAKDSALTLRSLELPWVPAVAAVSAVAGAARRCRPWQAVPGLG